MHTIIEGEERMSTTYAPDEPKKEKSKPPKRKKYHGHGMMMRTGWTQEELEKILTNICRKYPGLTNITVERNQIHWHFEVDKETIIPPPKYILGNPSKRKPTKLAVKRI